MTTYEEILELIERHQVICFTCYNYLQGPVDVDSFNINICTTRKQTLFLQSTAEKRELLTLFCT